MQTSLLSSLYFYSLMSALREKNEKKEKIEKKIEKKKKREKKGYI